jgi:hypothetical protein
MEKGTMRMGIGNVGMRVREMEMEWDEEYEPYGDVCGPRAYEEGEHEDRGRGDAEGE